MKLIQGNWSRNEYFLSSYYVLLVAPGSLGVNYKFCKCECRRDDVRESLCFYIAIKQYLLQYLAINCVVPVQNPIGQQHFSRVRKSKIIREGCVPFFLNVYHESRFSKPPCHLCCVILRRFSLHCGEKCSYGITGRAEETNKNEKRKRWVIKYILWIRESKRNKRGE
jgi:hypothetical protein